MLAKLTKARDRVEVALVETDLFVIREGLLNIVPRVGASFGGLGTRENRGGLFVLTSIQIHPFVIHRLTRVYHSLAASASLMLAISAQRAQE